MSPSSCFNHISNRGAVFGKSSSRCNEVALCNVLLRNAHHTVLFQLLSSFRSTSLISSMTSKLKKQHHLGTVLDYEDSSELREALESCTTCSELDWRTANLDPNTSKEESLEHELKRLQALRSYRVLDTGRKASFERLTALAARIFDVPICLVSLVDLGRQWFASNRGLDDTRETPRKVAFCAHAILSEMDVFIVPDTLDDPRFASNGLVTGDPLIRFYAGAPLVTRDGYKLGTLCIIDRKPKPNGLNLAEKQNLREIAALAMDQIEDTKIDLERSEKHQARMIACTAHDLITPLTSIQLNMGLICEDKELIKRMSKSQRETISNTKECVDIMSNICQHSIQVFRGESTAGRMDLEHHEEGVVDIAKVLHSLDHVMKTYPKTVPIVMRVDPDVPPLIKSEVLSIFRSSLNFLTNACKATEFGSIDFHLFMRYKSTHSSEGCDSLVFQCTDTGVGVDLENTSNLFTPDGGLMLSQETENGGLGLGLHSVSELISGLGGDYGYQPRTRKDDEIQNGSIFWFSVPVVLPDGSKSEEDTDSGEKNIIQDVGKLDMSNPAGDGSQRKSCSSATTESSYLYEATTRASVEAARAREMIENTSNDMKMEGVAATAEETHKMPVKRKSVSSSMDHIPRKVSQSFAIDKSVLKRRKCALVIDDSKTIRKVLKKALQNFGFDVKQAENGMQGLEEMKSTVFDIVLCDFLMPIMDGMDCVQQYRQWESNHRKWFKQYIVGISAHADSDDGDRGLNVGMNKFIPKPLPIKILRQLVDSEDIKEVSKKLDGLTDDSEALPYVLLVNPKSSLEPGGSTASSISDDYQDHAPTCLIVEDSKSIGKAMERLIERMGWKSCVARDGEEALRLLKSRNWDAVFMDDQLPILSGSTCVLKFREWEGKNRVARQKNLYMCSANCAQGSTLPSGFDGSLAKPFRPSTVLQILNKCVASQTSLV